MRTRRGLGLLAGAALLATVGLTATGPGSAAGATAAAADTTTSTKITVTARDGVKLVGLVVQPTAKGPWPVVVMPGTFAADSVNIDSLAKRLANRGYVTVSYVERGLGDSGGQIEVGGPDDVNDASDVLTWTLAHTKADPDRVGIAGISYGGGIAPLVALRDHRFKAVAMVSGWADMWRSRYPNNTSAAAANLALQVLSNTAGRPSPELKTFFENSARNVFTPQMRRTAEVRSIASYLPELKQHAVPMYISASMNETIWPVDQTVDFFEAYPGVKHLDLLPGDHSMTELATPFGLPGVTWETAFDWMDAYVAGTSTKAKALPPVRVAPRSGEGTDAARSDLFSTFPFEGYPGTGARALRRQYLNTASSWFGLVTSTRLTATAGSGGKNLRRGQNLLVDQGIPMYQGGFETVTGKPTTVTVAAVDQSVTGVWTGPALTTPVSLRGSTKVHLDLRPSAARGSVFVYLLDQAGTVGSTYLIGHKPYSWSGATSGAALPVDVTVPYNAYDLPAGHKLVVAVSTTDALYTDNNPVGSTVTVGPDSYVDLPLR